jgi:hypothetical protein
VSAREKRLIYHFTHVDNLRSILAAGALACDSGASEAGLATERDCAANGVTECFVRGYQMSASGRRT